MYYYELYWYESIYMNWHFFNNNYNIIAKKPKQNLYLNFKKKK